MVSAPGGNTCTQDSDCSASCGNGILDPNEQCDDGARNSNIYADRCRTTCVFPVCGDAVTDTGESCDDGNIRSDDGCSSACILEETLVGSIATCGDGILSTPEQCDDTNTVSGDGCRTDCTLEPSVLASAAYCGDGIAVAPEQCDDGNTTAGDRCSASCTIEGVVAATPLCGDGLLSSPEECDDNNVRDLDGCSPECLFERGRCGDGIIQKALDEVCEPSLHKGTLSYSCNPQTCRFLSATCGDGRIDLGEECDDALDNADIPDAVCRTDCSLHRCGDGIRDVGEECDDHNRLSGDGCSALCVRSTILAAGPFSDAWSFGTFPTFRVGPDGTMQPTVVRAPDGRMVPFASLQPIALSRPPAGDTGPAAVAIIASGAGAGLAWVRRRKRGGGS